MVSFRLSNLAHGLGAIALLGFVAGCSDTSGTVVDVDDSSLTVAEDDTQDQTTYRVSPDADVTRDGESASLLQVQPGDQVDITLGAAEGANVASDVHATSPDSDSDDVDFADNDADLDDTDDLIDSDLEGPIIAPPVVDSEPVALEGDVAAIYEESMMVRDETENEVEVIVDDHTEVTLDGISAEFGDILPGFAVFVSADAVDGRLHGDRIEATSTDITPPPVTDPESEPIDDDVDDADDPPPIDPDGVPGEEPEPVPETPDPQP